jgi:UDP-N-acetylglucosamine:LPS N-acetylglucosamine transferase
MGRRLRQADVIVCRAGADAGRDPAAGEASILIPLPTATDDPAAKRRGAGGNGRPSAAVTSGGVLAGQVLALVGDRDARVRMARAARALARPAARVIVDRALALAG